eukprot:TRINITY_DN1943_c0_g1_i5.p1 TRINITY_DN1943_c0_g1~~TRINITY_DN1943_c0_g1_i5.p1  ORF type:complete len:259 (+),score=57.68 TRINITY_DN1943_c0_g1_i5:117-893(+)
MQKTSSTIKTHLETEPNLMTSAPRINKFVSISPSKSGSKSNRDDDLRKLISRSHSNTERTSKSKGKKRPEVKPKNNCQNILEKTFAFEEKFLEEKYLALYDQITMKEKTVALRKAVKEMRDVVKKRQYSSKLFANELVVEEKRTLKLRKEGKNIQREIESTKSSIIREEIILRQNLEKLKKVEKQLISESATAEELKLQIIEKRKLLRQELKEFEEADNLAKESRTRALVLQGALKDIQNNRQHFILGTNQIVNRFFG